MLDGAGDGNRCFVRDRFHEDESGQVFAEGQTPITNLADEVGPAGDQLDDLIFAKTDLAQAVLEFRRRTESLDSHRHASLDAA